MLKTIRVSFYPCDSPQPSMIMKYRSIRNVCLLILLILLLTGCAGSYFSTMKDVQQAVQFEDYQYAEDLITGKEELQKARNLVLYFLEKGLIAHLNGKYEESNRLFEQAAQRMDELTITSVSGVASEWLLSSRGQPYRGEDFERVAVHYYMALNYLMLNDLESALIECRRVNTLLRELNDRYEHKNVYKTDAFMLYLSGIIYDAKGEVNDALIDYRQAYQVYLNDYQSNYGTLVPEQLTEHLLRTSSAMGSYDEFEQYKQAFPKKIWPSQKKYRNAARLVIIWDNSFIPYKAEQTFREYIKLNDEKEAGCYLKFAFPVLVPWNQTFTRAHVSAAGMTQPLEFVEDLARIAKKNLEDRRIRSIAKAITRNLIKCAAEYELEKENRGLGFLFGFLTELAESADTRHWSLLPAHIHLTQMLLPPGTSDIELILSGSLGQPAHRVTYKNISLQQGKTTFLMHRTF